MGGFSFLIRPNWCAKLEALEKVLVRVCEKEKYLQFERKILNIIPKTHFNFAPNVQQNISLIILPRIGINM